MKKIVLWLMSTLTALVLLFAYHTSTSSSMAAAGGTFSLAAPATTGPSSGSSPSGTSTTTTSSAVPGAVAETRWGPVQVQLTIADGKIANVSVVQYPNSNGKDKQINARALPILMRETLKAQSAKIDMVSGATYTSEGYLISLQSALDKVGL